MKWVEGACSPPPILKLPLLKLPIEERGCRKTRFLLGKILQSLIKANFSEYSFEIQKFALYKFPETKQAVNVNYVQSLPQRVSI